MLDPCIASTDHCTLVTVGLHLLSFGQLLYLLGWAIRHSNPGRDKRLFPKKFQTGCEHHPVSCSAGIGVLTLTWSDRAVKVKFCYIKGQG